MDCKDSFKCAMFKAYPVGTLMIAAPLYGCGSVLSRSDVAVDEDADHEEIGVSNGSLRIASKQSAALPGTCHTVTLEWEMDVATEADVDVIENLRHTAHDILFESYGNAYLVRADPDAYLLDVQYKSGTTSLTLTLVNGQGLTLLV